MSGRAIDTGLCMGFGSGHRHSIAVSSAVAQNPLENWFDQPGGLHLQAVCQLHDVEETDIPFAALHSTDVVAMQIGQLRQLFL